MQNIMKLLNLMCIVEFHALFFDNQLKKCLLFRGFDRSRYKSHSFRIGKATHCALKGHSDAYIYPAGRWQVDGTAHNFGNIYDCKTKQ